MIANTPPPPYYAVIFTSVRTIIDDGYEQMATYMLQLAEQQPGYLGCESARNDIGITVSYWSTIDAIKAWKQHAQHQIAQTLGREKWYAHYKIRICQVERDEVFG